MLPSYSTLYQLAVRWLLVTLLVATELSVVSGQPLSFKHLTVENGLSQNTVHDLQVDAWGFLWMGTADGLNRFDGYQIQRYRQSPDLPGGMMNTGVLQIQDDALGRIWILGEWGVECMLPGSERFIPIWRNQANDSIRKLVLQQTDTVAMLIGGNRLRYFSVATLKQVRDEPLGKHLMHEINIYAAKMNQAYWSIFQPVPDITSLTICFYRVDSAAPFCRRLPAPTGAQLMFQPVNFHRSLVLFGLKESGKSYLLLFDPAEDRVVYRKQVIGILDQPGTMLNRVLALPNRNQWYIFNNRGQILLTDSTLQTLAYYPFDKQEADGLGARFIMNAVWHQQTIWAATNPGGVAYATPGDRGFIRLNRNLNPKSTVKNIFTWHPDSVYACVVSEGIVRFNRYGEAVYNPPELPAAWRGVGRFAAFNSLTKQGGRLITLFGSQVFGQWDGTTGRYRDYWNKLSTLLPQFETNINYVHEVQKSGMVWFNYRNKLYRMNPITLNDLRQLNPVISFKADVTSLLEVRQTMWVGTTDGIYELRGTSSTLVAATQGAYVKSLRSEGDTILWIATTRGLCRWHIQNKQARWYTSKDGLPNNFVYGTLQEANGMVWMATNYGLCKLDPRTGRMASYYSRDGLTSNEFNSNSFFADSSGQFYFGAIGGINAFNPQTFTLPVANAPLRILQIRVNDQPYLDTAQAPWQIKSVSLSYEQNTVSIQFAGLYLPNAGLQQYRFQLKGLDTGWIYSNESRNVRYPKLEPGQYTFQVQSTMDGLTWSQSTAELAITIQKPFYRQGWFLLLAGLMLAGGGWLLFRMVLQWRLRRQLQELNMLRTLEEERRRISRDLHDNMGAYTSALLANVDQLKKRTGPANELYQMEANARQILSSLRETIWVLNNQSIQLTRFSDEFKSYCLRLLVSFEHITFKVHESNIPTKAITATAAIHLNKVLQELVQNVIKHAAATEISYRLYTNLDTTETTLELIDNGKGFDLPTVHPGQGLENLAWRAAKGQFSVHLETRVGQGTKAIIKLLPGAFTP